MYFVSLLFFTITVLFYNTLYICIKSYNFKVLHSKIVLPQQITDKLISKDFSKDTYIIRKEFPNHVKNLFFIPKSC